MTVVHLSAEEMDGFARSRDDHPAIAKLYELTVEEAERASGVGLQAMRLHLGHMFGDPVMMTHDEVAKRLGVSEEDVAHALDPIHQAAAERWKATEEFKRWRSPENFSYANFSKEASDAVWAAGVFAFDAGASAVTTEHLRAALEAPAPVPKPKRGRTVTNFDERLVTVVRSAHVAAVGAGGDVEVRHLHEALAAAAPEE